MPEPFDVLHPVPSEAEFQNNDTNLYAMPIRQLRRDWLHTWHNYNMRCDNDFGVVTGRGSQFGIEPMKFVTHVIEVPSRASIITKEDSKHALRDFIRADETPCEPDLVSCEKSHHDDLADTKPAKYRVHLDSDNLSDGMATEYNTTSNITSSADNQTEYTVDEKRPPKTKHRPRSKLTKNNIFKCKICGTCSAIIRYTCVQCPEFHICPHCELADLHSMHYLLRLPAGGGASRNEAQSVLAGARRALSLSRLQSETEKEKQRSTSSSGHLIYKDLASSTRVSGVVGVDIQRKDEDNSTPELKEQESKIPIKNVQKVNESRTTQKEILLKAPISSCEWENLSSSSNDSQKLINIIEKKITEIKVPRLKTKKKSSATSTKAKTYNATIERKRSVVEKVIHVSPHQLDMLLSSSEDSLKYKKNKATPASSDQKFNETFSDSDSAKLCETKNTPPVFKVNTMIYNVKNFCDSQTCHKCKKEIVENTADNKNSRSNNSLSNRVWSSKYDSRHNFNKAEKILSNRVIICAKHNEKCDKPAKAAISSNKNEFLVNKDRISLKHYDHKKFDQSSRDNYKPTTSSCTKANVRNIKMYSARETTVKEKKSLFHSARDQPNSKTEQERFYRSNISKKIDETLQHSQPRGLKSSGLRAETNTRSQRQFHPHLLSPTMRNYERKEGILFLKL